MHISKINYVDFFSSAFFVLNEAEKFIDEVESSKTKAKIVLHQCARLLWLADRIEEVASRRPAFQIMFYMIAAEAIAKIVFDYKGNRDSKEYVKKFFEEICIEKHHNKLAIAFANNDKYLSLIETVDYLYKIRCDVAHEGKYFDVRFNDDKRDSPVIASIFQPEFEVYISHRDIRQIILEGAVLGAKEILSKNFPLNE